MHALVEGVDLMALAQSGLVLAIEVDVRRLRRVVALRSLVEGLIAKFMITI